MKIGNGIGDDVIRFDVLQGRCAKCDGPVYFTRVLDCEGRKVNSLQCWNGHYEKIEIETFDLADVMDDLTPENIDEILPFVGFVRLNESHADE